ncbi:MAG: hypothetical protein KatS3mg068_1863 [Candidatus Sericytochromatia bacterium]|nr:MAG: hypothetical protein KatS3mg068_1863 [Candidatus Sericytochromatia bacterium]
MINKIVKIFLLLIIIFSFSNEAELFLYDFRIYLSSLIKNKVSNEFIIIECSYNYIGNNIVFINTLNKLKNAKAIVIDSTLIKYDKYFLELLSIIRKRNNIFLTKEYIYKGKNLYLFSNNYFEDITGVTNYNNVVREYRNVYFNLIENKLEYSIEFIIYNKFYKSNNFLDSFKIRYILMPNMIKKINIDDLNIQKVNSFDNKIIFLSYNNNYVFFPFTKKKFLQSELIINNIMSLENKVFIKSINLYLYLIIIIIFIFIGYFARKQLNRIVLISLIYIIFNVLLFLSIDLYINIVYTLIALFLFKLITQDSLNIDIVNKFNFSHKIKFKNKVLTILFCDIEDFTLITEKLSNEKLLEILNDFLNSMTEIIINNNGHIDKYIGDGFMAFFNNPIDSINASIKMYNELECLQKKWLELGIRPFQMRIGISTGEVTLANIGHKSKIQSTVIGDTVNLASRLEKLNKNYNTYILISKSTYENIKDFFKTKFVGTISIKGKSEKIDIYEVKIE